MVCKCSRLVFIVCLPGQLASLIFPSFFFFFSLFIGPYLSFYFLCLLLKFVSFLNCWYYGGDNSSRLIVNQQLMLHMGMSF